MIRKPEQESNNFQISVEEPEKIHNTIEMGFRRHLMPFKMFVEDWVTGKVGKLEDYYTPEGETLRKNRTVELGRAEFLPPSLFSKLHAYIHLSGVMKTYKPTFFAFYGSTLQANWNKDGINEFRDKLIKSYQNTQVHYLPTDDGFHTFRIDHLPERTASYVFLGYENAKQFELADKANEEMAVKEFGFEINLMRGPRISLTLYPIGTPPEDIIDLDLSAQQLLLDKPENFSRQIRSWVTDIENTLRITALVKGENLEGTFTLRAPEL